MYQSKNSFEEHPLFLVSQLDRCVDTCVTGYMLQLVPVQPLQCSSYQDNTAKSAIVYVAYDQ